MPCWSGRWSWLQRADPVRPGSADSLCAVIRFRRLLTPVLAVFLLAGCMSSGEPVSWEDQADESGEGLVEREFTAACMEANDDLSVVKSRTFCACVLDGVQAVVTFEVFTELDDFIDKHRDDVTAAMLGEHFGWFVEATEACAT